MSLRRLLLATLPLVLAACATTGNRTASTPAASVPAAAATAPPEAPRTSPYAPAQEDPSKRGDYVAGGLFQPGVPDTVPADIPDVDAIPEPVVRDEPRARTGNRDYVVLGRKYRVLDDAEGYVEEGNASYYGNKFHGRRTSSSEVYDMYAFTAAHRTLPLPSYVRVTNLANGRSIIVRVNDRGPFHANRIIDLSYAAAVKLGYRERGTARVRVEALTPEDEGSDVARRPATPTMPQATPPATPSGMDRLVAGLPQASAAVAMSPAPPVPPGAQGATAADPSPAASQASRAVPAPSSAANGNRFYMQQGGRNMTAGEFDAWMGARGIRVATGRPEPARSTPAATESRPAAPPTVASVALASVPAAAVQPGPAAHAATTQASGPVTGATSPATPLPESGGAAVVLQVASFSNEENARQALSVLQHAAVTQARLLVAEVGGRQVWRLRVGPVEPESVSELASRIEGLGMGRPQRVID